ncbi:asparaginase [Actinomadura barringtoniae]|uniref:Asparaginase n=1 Tax=Actinomadura barringtoniae TaxID=1427535 RepID=A0A939PL81_9ACTN|nr:asparaginase domain-containing protein [Actinomadura barringtoniae]MBO2454382.1 asparaginase [Actinomadura barringtoniae]
MKRILILATNDPAYPDEALPAQVTVEHVLAEPSWDTSTATMLTLARRTRSALLEDFDGVVITHGPDTVEETAYLTDLLLGPAASQGAVIFTTTPNDLPASLTAAAAPALQGAGALVCAATHLHAARYVTYTDATTPTGFSSSPHLHLAQITQDRIDLLAPPPPPHPKTPPEPEPNVSLLKTYPGIDPALLTTLVDAGARGIVLEGTGQGNIPVTLFTTISDLTAWDIPVVIASRSQTTTTPLDDLPYEIGLAAKVGAIGARGLPPTKARIALMAALGNGGGLTAAHSWFATL